jgi:hypothetical protein
MTTKKMIKSLLNWQNWYTREDLEYMTYSELLETYNYYGDMLMGG